VRSRGWLAAVLLGACGSAPLGDPFAEFAREVQRAVAAAGSTYNCAAPLPGETLGGPEDLRGAVRRYLVAVLGVRADEIEVIPKPCGTAGAAACASLFQHDLFKSDGRLGTALYPLAQEVERVARFVEVAVWDPATGPGPAITIAGVRDGRLFGIAFFNALARCS
jgi:hypothetical protein